MATIEKLSINKFLIKLTRTLELNLLKESIQFQFYGKETITYLKFLRMI